MDVVLDKKITPYASAIEVTTTGTYAGFVITDMYEDYMLDSPLHKYHPSYIATRALKK